MEEEFFSKSVPTRLSKTPFSRGETFRPALNNLLFGTECVWDRDIHHPGSGERPEDVDLADIVNQSEPRTRPLYIHFVGEARIALNPKYPRRLASEAEVLALRPELNRIE